MNEVLGEGFSLMCIGMGTVLTFLCIMIAAMSVMSKVVIKLNQIFPEPVAQTAGGGKQKAASDESEIAAAIVAALFKRQ